MVNTQADSEIPELGLDSARINLDCDINPARVADAALRIARKYGDYRKKRRPIKSSSNVKRKRTRIDISRDYERSTSKHNKPSDQEDDDD